MSVEWKYLEELISRYQGTCNMLLEHHFDWMEKHDLLQEFDQEIFNCHICGWWCEISESAAHESYELICEDCVRDI